MIYNWLNQIACRKERLEFELRQQGQDVSFGITLVIDKVWWYSQREGRVRLVQGDLRLRVPVLVYDPHLDDYRVFEFDDT
jgi:hypothetical protein